MMEIAKFILSILRYFPTIVMSWGFHKPLAVENGLRFNVMGYLHIGKVEVLYDEGYDLFTIRLLNPDGSIKKAEDGVYLDCLVDVIDGMVERCEDYADRVRQDYCIVK